MNQLRLLAPAHDETLFPKQVTYVPRALHAKVEEKAYGQRLTPNIDCSTIAVLALLRRSTGRKSLFPNQCISMHSRVSYTD
jgi:hypothetical protein